MTTKWKLGEGVDAYIRHKANLIDKLIINAGQYYQVQDEAIGDFIAGLATALEVPSFSTGAVSFQRYEDKISVVNFSPPKTVQLTCKQVETLLKRLWACKKRWKIDY